MCLELCSCAPQNVNNICLYYYVYVIEVYKWNSKKNTAKTDVPCCQATAWHQFCWTIVWKITRLANLHWTRIGIEQIEILGGQGFLGEVDLTCVVGLDDPLQLWTRQTPVLRFFVNGNVLDINFKQLGSQISGNNITRISLLLCLNEPRSPMGMRCWMLPLACTSTSLESTRSCEKPFCGKVIAWWASSNVVPQTLSYIVTLFSIS